MVKDMLELFNIGDVIINIDIFINPENNLNLTENCRQLIATKRQNKLVWVENKQK